jgi:hypothetical protein
MRLLFSAVFVLLVCAGLAAQTTVFTTPEDSSASVFRKRVVIVRTGPQVKQHPEKKRATVYYPVVDGLRDAEVLRKVRALLALKNIFDMSLAEYRRDTWLDELDFTVNYNYHGILDITFTQRGSAAYPDSQSKHLAIDLKTGNLLKAADVFHVTKLDELARLVDQKLQAEVADLISETKKDPHLDESQKQNIIDALELQKFELKNVDDFSVGLTGITFLYDAGFPHVIQALQPDGKYLLNYRDLKPFIKPDGKLGHLSGAY